MDLFVYAAGGFGREVAWLAEACNQPESPINVLGFIDDTLALQGTTSNGYPIITPEAGAAEHPGAAVAVAIGEPAARRAMTEKAIGLGLTEIRLVHPTVQASRWLEIGDGCVICAGTILTTNIELGRGVQLNLGCTVGHDVRMGDYVTLAPGAHVSGRVHIEDDVYVGSGAVIINGAPERPLVIGRGAVIGAGACVVKDVEPGTTVVGVPARPRER